MHKWQLFITLTVLFTLAFSSAAHAQLSQISSGLSSLVSSQNPDGTWGADTSLVETTATTVSALETLKQLNQTAGTAFSTGVTWLQGQSLQGVDPVAGRIRVLALTDGSSDALLPAFEQFKGAWAGDEGYDTNNLDTAFAIQALKAANSPDQTIITSALNYLTSTQNLDGGWGFATGDDSSVYVTALVSRTIQQFLQTTARATALNKATSYLLTKQNSDGGFGSSSSTVHETALSYNAVVAVITDATALGKAVGFLTTNQSADGSWLQDPYSTALALQALHYSENRPTLPLPPTTGTLAGKIVSAATRESLAGVTVSLANNPVIATTTDSGGTFKLDNVPQGSQQISLSLSGYATSSLLTTVTAGGISNLGTLTLTSASSSGVINGVIIDEATGLPLAGVFITLYPPVGDPRVAAVTSTNGTYRINIAPEHYGIAASKEGYATIHNAYTISAGDVLDFSPMLSSTPLSATTGEVMGKVIDENTSAPLAGVVITLVGVKNYTTTTSANGQYHIFNVDPGGYTMSLKAPGYFDWHSNYELSIYKGEIDYEGTKRLSPSPIATTINGKVTDSTTNMPIANAEVYITGTTFAAKTDSSGSYTIQGINLLNFELKASAPGCFAKSYKLINQYHGTFTVDFSLAASRSTYAKILSVVTDRQAYQAYADVAIAADIVNSDTLPVTISVNVTILNAQGEVIANMPVTEPDSVGIAYTSITLQPGIAKSVNINWGTGSRPPGDYSVIVKIVEDTSVTGLETMVIAQQSHKLTIEPTQTIATLSLTPLPRFTNLGATEQIGLQASVINRSNVPSELLFTYDWMGSDGAVIHTGSGKISLQPEEASKSVLLESFQFTFNASGEYLLQLRIASGPMPVNLVGGVVFVAPGIRIEPSQSLTPATVIPDGDKRIRMNIRLKGVVVK